MIQHATAAFADVGYAGASLDRIAAAAGMRKSSLVYRFGGKEALYLAALEAAAGRLAEMVAAAAAGEHSWVDRLDRLSGVITDYFGSEAGAARLLFREVMDRGPFFTGEGRALFEQIVRVAAAFLEAGTDAGEFDVVDPVGAVMSIAGLHLTWFAAADLVRLVDEDAASPKGVPARREAVVRHVRRVCGVAAA